MPRLSFYMDAQIHVNSGPHACTTYSLLTKLTVSAPPSIFCRLLWLKRTHTTNSGNALCSTCSQRKAFLCWKCTLQSSSGFLKAYLFLFYVCKRFLSPCIYLCTGCVQCPQRPEAGVRSSDSCGHHEGAGNRAWILCQSSECSWLLSHLSTLSVILNELQLPWSTATALGPLRRGSQSSHILQAWTFYTDQSIHSQ